MKKTAVILVLLSLAQLSLGYRASRSGNVYDTNGSASDVQAALDAAPSGSTIKIPAGHFVWNTYVHGSRGIRLEGAGPGKTTVETITPQQYRSVVSLRCDTFGVIVTGISWLNQFNFDIGSDPNTGTFRVYNCTFDNGTIQSVFLNFGGNGRGLIDHCTFSAGGASEMIHNNGLGADYNGAIQGWKNDIHPGTDEALYIENCTFSKNPLEDAYFWGTSALQGYYGSRTVIRHVRLNAAHIDQHGTAGMVGARWFEFYDNAFHVPPPHGDYAGMAQSDYIALRGGSGVVFNNTVSGHNLWGNGNVTIYDENGGAEPLYVGRGIITTGDPNPSPIYLWHNFQFDGSPMAVIASSENVKANREFFVSDSQPATMKRWQQKADNANTTYSYHPFEYPHPLDDLPSDQFGPVSGGGPQPTPTPTPTPQPTPTPPIPTPTPTPVPTPPPTGGQDYSDWLNRLSEWIRSNPPEPNGR